MKVLITGGAGFIGSNFIRYFINSRRDAEIVNFDSLTYAGNPESLADIAENPRYKFVRGDITDKQAVDSVFEERFDALVNFAAETHVDRSIEDASPFCAPMFWARNACWTPPSVSSLLNLCRSAPMKFMAARPPAAVSRKKRFWIREALMPPARPRPTTLFRLMRILMDFRR